VALYPQRNEHREILDLSGLWSFQLDPREVGESEGWAQRLPAPRSIAVPGSWNEQFADARDYLGVAWHLTRIVVPPSWRGQTVMLRVGSATYAAKVWVDGTFAGAHLGGHLPFEFDISPLLAWQGATTIAIQVENKPMPTRVPPAATNPEATANTYPDVTYDFFPYAGLHRPVILYCVPELHIADVTIVTSIEGADGLGAPLTERLRADGVVVIDVPAKPARRVRMLLAGHGRKSDEADALSVGIAAWSASCAAHGGG